MKQALILLLLVLAPLVQAQVPYHPQRPDLTPDQAENLRNRGQNYDRHYQHPRWCRNYDQRDYRREMRSCGDDRSCRWEVRRKAERCGLR